MKKIILVMSLLVSSQMVGAEVYSCGPGCYTSKPSKGYGKADLGQKIGSYTSIPAPHVTSTPPATAAAKQPVQTAQTAQTAAQRVPSVSPSARSVAVSAPARINTPAISAAKLSGRRTILEQELNNERTALAMAQKALAEGRAVNSGQSDTVHQLNVRKLESAVLDRQQNIQALQRELGRM